MPTSAYPQCSLHCLPQSIRLHGVLSDGSAVRSPTPRIVLFEHGQ